MSVLTETQIQLLHTLADGQFHTSRNLASMLGVSHSTVSQQIKGFKDIGLDVHAVQGRGTRLSKPLDLLNHSAIEDALTAPALALLKGLVVLHETTSTNEHLMRQGDDQDHAGLVCLAEMQTQGKGRRGRAWVSPFGQNIYLSILYRFNAGLAGLSGLSLACGVQVALVLQALGVHDVGLKWPNDLLWQGRKLGGILIEIQGETEGSCRAVIGLGLNVQMPTVVADSIDQPWVDLNSVLGEASISRNQLASSLINHLLPMLESFDAQGLEPFLDHWAQFDCLRGQPVQLSNGQQTQTGIAEGISSVGELLLRGPDGELTKVHGGEVSLRAL